MKKYFLIVFYGYIMRYLLRYIVGVRMDDTDFLQDEDQFIIVANHNSHLDTMSILSSLPRSIIHKVKPVAAVDHFGRTKWKAALTTFFVNALLIQRKRNRDNPLEDPIYQMLAELDKGYSLIIFPEGTRGQPEVDAPLKGGIGLILSQRPHIKYVPAYMKGLGKAMPKGDSLILPYNSSLKYGNPSLVQVNAAKEIVDEIKSSLMQLKHRK